jgi:hypothetical protein
MRQKIIILTILFIGVVGGTLGYQAYTTKQKNDALAYATKQKYDALVSLVKLASIRTENVMYHLDANDLGSAEKIKDSLAEIDRLITSVQLMENNHLNNDVVTYLRACYSVINSMEKKMKQQDLGEHEIALALEYLVDASRALATTLPKDALINNIKIEGPLDRVKTLAGILNISTSEQEDSRPDTLNLNGKPIFKDEMEFVSIAALYALQDKDVILISTNGGGSGSIDIYSIVIIAKGMTPVIIRNDNFFSSEGGFDLVLRDDNLIIDLGFENGLHKMAYLNQKNTLSIETKKEVAPEPVDDATCKELYSIISDGECANFGCKEGISGLSMRDQRTYYAFSQRPSVDRKLINKLCIEACTTKAIPNYLQFTKACGR